MGADNGRGWVCLVCGYVHRGTAPPENCPVCGAARTDFEPYEAPSPTPSRPEPELWRCLICNYTHAGPEPPANCPVCGALANDFEPGEEAEKDLAGRGEGGKVFVVGGGIAGVSAVEALRQASPSADITLVSKEPGLPYYRLNLTRFLAGEIGEDALPIHPAQWYEEQRIRLVPDTEVTAILPGERFIETDNEGGETFDKVVLACGAHPLIPPIPGASREGVTALRTRAQAKALLARVTPDMPCVCIGGGILGLETAGALAKRGARVTVLEGYDWLLPRQLNQRAGETLARSVAELGITVRVGAKTTEIVGDERVRGVALADAVFPADLVVIAAGVRPNSYLARQAGLEVNQGIVVNSYLASSHPDILAAGDVAEHRGALYGLWEPARYQGAIAGMNAAGFSKEFGGLPRINTLKVLGLDLFSIGVIVPQDGSYEEVCDESDGHYRRFLFRDNCLVGAILLGETHGTSAVARAVKNRLDFSGVLLQHPEARDIVAFLAETG